MSDLTKQSPERSVDVVLQETWRIKDELSAIRQHNVHRLFSEARERQKASKHQVANFENSQEEV